MGFSIKRTYRKAKNVAKKATEAVVTPHKKIVKEVDRFGSRAGREWNRFGDDVENELERTSRRFVQYVFGRNGGSRQSSNRASNAKAADYQANDKFKGYGSRGEESLTSAITQRQNLTGFENRNVFGEEEDSKKKKSKTLLG